MTPCYLPNSKDFIYWVIIIYWEHLQNSFIKFSQHYEVVIITPFFYTEKKSRFSKRQNNLSQVSGEVVIKIWVGLIRKPILSTVKSWLTWGLGSQRVTCHREDNRSALLPLGQQPLISYLIFLLHGVFHIYFPEQSQVIKSLGININLTLKQVCTMWHYLPSPPMYYVS